MLNTSVYKLVGGLFYEFTAVNKNQDTAAFVVREAADLGENNGFARAGGHNKQRLRILGQCASELGNG